jgi:hypothetical protein
MNKDYVLVAGYTVCYEGCVWLLLLLEKIIVPQLDKKFSAVLGIRVLITVYTTANQ